MRSNQIKITVHGKSSVTIGKETYYPEREQVISFNNVNEKEAFKVIITDLNKDFKDRKVNIKIEIIE